MENNPLVSPRNRARGMSYKQFVYIQKLCSSCPERKAFADSYCSKIDKQYIDFTVNDASCLLDKLTSIRLTLPAIPEGLSSSHHCEQ